MFFMSDSNTTGLLFISSRFHVESRNKLPGQTTRNGEKLMHYDDSHDDTDNDSES